MTRATKMIMRSLGLFALVIVLLCSTMTTVFASDVKSISLRAVSNGDLKYPTIESRSSKYEVTDVSWSKSEDNLNAGDTVTGTVVVSPTDDNKIYISSKSNIKISGTGVEVTSYSRSGSDFKIKIRYTVQGELNSPEEAYWDENSPWIARWKKVSNADEYQIRLYVGSSRKYTKTTKSTSYNFAEELAKKGIYEKDDVYFSVRAVSDDNDNSDWVDSDYLDDDDWYEIWYYCKSRNISINGRDDDDDDDDWNHRWWGGSTSSKRSGWYRESDGSWYYYDTNNGNVKTGWQYINGYWYYLKTDNPNKGRMLTGWLQEPSGWYYLDPYTDPIGRMLSNQWRYIDGYWYYFGSDGLAYTGEHYIDGNWYYFFTSYYYGNPECSMAANISVNGHYYDASGRRVY